jgi:purine-nucleoside phosphorylase, family 1 (deoD)
MKNTPHINQTAPIAETILLPGDPLRAKFIADNFLSDAQQFNAVRNILGFTGKYNGKEVSVMATGMGNPSIGIYSYELINFFGVKNLIRVGSCGAIQKDIKLYDIIFAMGSCYDSHFADQFKLSGNMSPIASWKLLNTAYKTAENLGITPHVGNVLATDVFYGEDIQDTFNWAKMGVLAAEMESTALYLNAARYNANALCILTVSDNMVTKEETTAEERQTAFTTMMKLALETAIQL